MTVLAQAARQKEHVGPQSFVVLRHLVWISPAYAGSGELTFAAIYVICLPACALAAW